MTEKERRLAEKNDTLEKMYGKRVNVLIRKKYDQDAVEAILNNYIADPDNSGYVKEFKALQEYRAFCKETARKEIYGT